MRGLSPTPQIMVLCCVAAASCGGSVRVSESRGVVRTERVWVDSSRTTPPTTAYAGAPARTLRVLIWQPSDASDAPLLVMAHGFGGLPEKFDAFARAVAAAGYVVAAPAFPLTNESAPGGHDAGLRDFVHQPADVSFVITQLLQEAGAGKLPLAPTAIAVLGHSLGGVTVLGLTRKQCCRDDRVRASIVVAAPLLLVDGFGRDPVADGPPTLIIQGTADRSVDYSNGPQLYDEIQPPRFLLGLPGAGHSDAVEDQSEPPLPARDAAQRTSIAFLDAVFRGADAALDGTLASLAAEGSIVQAQRD